LGATGSGKSTLLRAATGLAPSLLGVATTGGFRTNARRLGYVPQDALDGFLSFDAEHEILLRLRARGASKPEAEREVRGRLEGLGLGERGRVPVHHLSAGERRRLLLAAVQTHEPDVLLLDEPFNHVDADWRPRLAADARRAARERLVLVATHDPRPWQDEVTPTLVLRDGRLIYEGPLDGLDPRSHPELRLLPPVPAVQGTPRRAGPSLEFEDVSFTIGRAPILSGLRLRWGPGLHALTGPNGAGKTTLLRLAAGLARPSHGRVRVDGHDAQEATGRVRHVALQFEEPAGAFFARTGRDELAFAPTNQGLAACDVQARLRAAVGGFDLEPLVDRHPYTLSGGERERLALACLETADAPVVLLDEPTQGLDAGGRRVLFGFLERLARDRCVVAATHDDELIARAHAVHRLESGRLLETATEAFARIPS
jgi:energy-coupling factor transport system ATP-binding protein